MKLGHQDHVSHESYYKNTLINTTGSMSHPQHLDRMLGSSDAVAPFGGMVIHICTCGAVAQFCKVFL